MQILCIGDPHFRVRNTAETLILEKETFSVIEEQKIDLVVVLGDVLNDHDIIHLGPLMRALNFLRALSRRVLTYVLVGNHDRANNEVYLTSEHPFTAINEENLVIVDKPIISTFGENNFAFVPYVYKGRFVEALGDLPWKDCRCIFAHQEFKGVKMGDIISIDGDEWKEEWPLVVSGHIHTYQVLKNVIYTGSPLYHAYGDRTIKSFSLLTIGKKIVHSRIPLKSIKKKKTLRIPLCKLEGLQLDPGEEDLKVVIYGTSDEIKAKSYLICQKTREWEALGIKVEKKTMSDQKDIEHEEMPFRDLLWQEAEVQGLLDIFNLIETK